MPRTIFITGASSGIGAALARRYAEPGVLLALCARRADLLAELAGDVEARGAQAAVFVASVADTEAVGRVSSEILEKHGCPDVVIANAAVGGRKPLLSATPEEIAQVLQTNLIGVTNSLMPFAPLMARAGRGTLVAVSSMAGHRVLPGSTVYSSSKAAVIAFMDGLRMELVGTGVRVLTLCPGFVRTAMSDAAGAPRPFMLEVDEAAEIMIRAIERRVGTYSFPWQMALLRHPLRLLPERAVLAIGALKRRGA
jgi:short-subunit dehydrogenase